MTKTFALALASVATIALAMPASAAQLATTVSASGDYEGTLSTLNDGFIPAHFDGYSANSVYNFNDTIFTFDFGGVKTVNDVFAAFDNNDDYAVKFFNGATLVGTFSVGAGDGPVTAWEGGFDHFASYAGTGITQIGGSFSLLADRAEVIGLGGDGLFGIGEVQFFGSGAVPEPSSWALMIGGFGLLGATLRRSRKTVSFA